MSDDKKQLDALKAKLGLMRATDIVPKPETKRVQRSSHTHAQPEEKSGGVLSNALAAQLRARLGLDAVTATTDVAHTDGEPVEIDAVVPGACIGDDDYAFFRCRTCYPLDHAIGDIPLGDALRCAGREIALSACDESLLGFDPRTTCFMDTETTGLAGGAGTVAFLVGVGYFDASQFVLEQCFLRDYDDEGAMLDYLADKLTRFSAVVSYNGKSFDMPLLRARFVQHRIPFPLEDAGHYDLVHAARRVWKQRLKSCTLGNIEKEVLGLRRHGDVPGYLIPQLWLNYLDARDARPLAPVFYHHEMDILSLVALTGHLAQALAAKDGADFHHAEDRLSVVRLYVKNKQYDAAIAEAQRFLETSRIPDALRRECLTLLGKSCKRAGLYEDMAAAWALMHEEFPHDAFAAAELAKYKEHQERDFAGAIEVCKETLAQIEAMPAASDFTVSALRGRLARLEGKQARLRNKYASEDAFFLDE